MNTEHLSIDPIIHATGLPADVDMCGKRWLETGDPFNRCTECKWGEDAPVCGCGPHTMTAHDNDGEFCLRCGHAPECHKSPCIVCNGTRVIPSIGDCPECSTPSPKP